MKCRLLYVIGNLQAGGAQRQLCYLLQAMDRERYKPIVVVWSFSENDFYVPVVRTLGVPMHGLSCTLSPAAKLVAFGRFVRKLKPEVVHSYIFFTNFAVELARIGVNTIPIGSIRNDFVHDCRKAGKFLGKLSARWPRAQICNSLAAHRSVMERSGLFKPAWHHVVRNGLDIDQFKFNTMLPSEPKLLAVGRLSPKKRWDRLLHVIASASARGLAFTVQHVGVGPLAQQFKVQAKDLGVEGLIKFLGYRHDIPTLLAQSTFLIHTADHEGFPNIVMEAMACGRAVVATDAGDVPSLVEDGKTGFVVRRGDDAMLLEKMSTLINDRDLCRQMGQAGRTKAERDFGLDRLISETLATYRAAGWRD